MLKIFGHPCATGTCFLSVFGFDFDFSEVTFLRWLFNFFKDAYIIRSRVLSIGSC